MDFEIRTRVLAALEARGVRYAIIGAVVLNLHGLARSTEGLDVFVEPDAGRGASSPASTSTAVSTR